MNSNLENFKLSKLIDEVPDASAQQVDEPLESDISMEVDVEVEKSWQNH